MEITAQFKYGLFLLKKRKILVAGLTLFAIVFFIALFGPLLAPADPYEVKLDEKLLPPSPEHIFGTDMLGRDVLSRIFYGIRNTLLAAAISVSFGLTIGTLLGGIGAYISPKVDWILMRLADILLAFPTLIFAMALCSVLGPSLTHSAIAVGITFIPNYMRLIRSKVLTIKESEYIEAERSIGASNWRIFFMHILPNAISPLFVASMVYAGYGILWTTSLSFIGLGVQPPAPELGLMILEGRRYILSGEWWVTFFPGLFIAMAIAAFNFIGDGLRDLLSPKLRIT